jgi:DNA invertase Pin-like site-specific DNA recombinase
MTTPQIIAASYERVSTRIQGRYGFSLGVQHQTLEEFVAAREGWVLPAHLRFRDGEEENASGTDWDLPDLTRMLEAARNREFQVLVVPDFDRFARSLVKGLVLEEQLKKYGVRVVYQRVPVDDSPEGQLLKTQLYAFAEYDRQKIALRLMLGRRGKAQTGRVVGIGPAPYGYRFAYEALAIGKRRVCGLEHRTDRPRHPAEPPQPLHAGGDARPQPAGHSFAERQSLECHDAIPHGPEPRLYRHLGLRQARATVDSGAARRDSRPGSRAHPTR